MQSCIEDRRPVEDALEPHSRHGFNVARLILSAAPLKSLQCVPFVLRRQGRAHL